MQLDVFKMVLLLLPIQYKCFARWYTYIYVPLNYFGQYSSSKDVCMYVCMYACMYVCMYVYIYLCINT